MKIGMISLYLPSGSKIGSGYQAHAMANAFASRGHQVTMHSPCEKPADALYEHQQVDVGSRCRTFRFAWELRKLDWSGYDVVHAHGDDYLLWSREPVHVRTMHGSCLNEAVHIPGLKEKLRMLLLGLSEIAASIVAHRTVAVSHNTRRTYPWIRTMIPNGVDMSSFYPGNMHAERPTILFVGTYANRKRGRLLMQAFTEHVLPVHSDAQLWMVCGDAPAAPGVTVFGRVSEERLAELYRRAWVFCLPSSYEGFGVPYIEAMASGTPVVATPNPGAREVLDDGHFGILTTPEDLGRRLAKLLGDPAARSMLSSRGLERIQRYSWDAVIHQYLELYRSVSRRKPAVLPAGSVTLS